MTRFVTLAARAWRYAALRLGSAGASNPMLRPVGLLLSGAALGQVANLLALPLLTRVYTPNDFNVLALFAALSIICSLGACLGFDLAIPLARTRRDAARLLGCAAISIGVVSAVVAVLCVILLAWEPPWVARWPVSVFVLLPVSTAVVGSFNAVASWTLRDRRFAILARAGVHQAVWGSVAQIGLGIAGLGSLGLMIGYIIISGFGIIQLAHAAWRTNRPPRMLITAVGMRSVARRYSAFSRFTSVEAFANACSVYAPMLLISAVASGPEMGFVMLAQRLLQAPLMLIGRSVSTVYTAHVAELLRNGTLGQEMASLLRALIGMAWGPLLFAVVCAPVLASIVLGPAWRPVGIYIAWLAPWAVLHFLSSSVLTTMHARGRNVTVMALTIAGLLFRLAAVGAAALTVPQYIVHAYALSGALYYGLQMAILLVVNRIRLFDLRPRGHLAWSNLAGFGGLTALFVVLFR